MKIAITGSRGRVGRGVVALALAQGHGVVGIDRSPPGDELGQRGVTQVQAEITDYAAIASAMAGCDALVHLAAIPSPRGHPDYVVHNNNVVSSYNALSAAAHLGITRVCQASSVNATGAAYSRWPRYDYLPLDEAHPTYNEDPYALSKWICEQQADSFARRYEEMTIASLRFHWVTPQRPVFVSSLPNYDTIIENRSRDLWGHVLLEAVARACLLSLSAGFRGHEVFYIVAPATALDTPSLELKERYYPQVPVRGDLSGTRGFYNCEKARQMLGWQHDQTTE